MIVKIVYNDSKEEYSKEVAEIFSGQQYEVELYNEDFYKNHKKAMLIKASCGTKLIPLVAVYNDNKELIKVFYQEDKSNNIENIKSWENLKETT